MERLHHCSIPYNFIRKIRVAIIRITRIQRRHKLILRNLLLQFFPPKQNCLLYFRLILYFHSHCQQEIDEFEKPADAHIHAHTSLRSLDRAIFARLCRTCTRPNSYVLFITVSTSGC